MKQNKICVVSYLLKESAPNLKFKVFIFSIKIRRRRECHRVHVALTIIHNSRRSTISTINNYTTCNNSRRRTSSIISKSRMRTTTCVSNQTSLANNSSSSTRLRMRRRLQERARATALINNNIKMRPAVLLITSSSTVTMPRLALQIMATVDTLLSTCWAPRRASSKANRRTARRRCRLRHSPQAGCRLNCPVWRTR